jgi:NADP-dependent 3-hydroxy acid dehydrogenase YdfG
VFGRLDILVNNAGLGDLTTIQDTTIEEWNRTIDIDQTGVFLGMKIAAPHLKRSEHASIINISSIHGTSGGFGTSPAYHEANGALRTLTNNAALHRATEGIRDERTDRVMNPEFTRLHHPTRWHFDVRRGLDALADSGTHTTLVWTTP